MIGLYSQSNGYAFSCSCLYICLIALILYDQVARRRSVPTNGWEGHVILYAHSTSYFEGGWRWRP